MTEQQAKEDRKERYARLEAWGSVATAIFTGIGLTIAIGALVVAYVSYLSVERDAELKATADAMSEWSKASPANIPHCFRFLATLDANRLGQIVARQETKYPETAEAQDSLSACISDQSEDVIRTLVDKDQHKLSPKGASFLAERVDTALDADDVVATLIVEGIGRRDILNRKIGRIICRDDITLVRTLHQVPKREDSYPSILSFAALP